MKLAPVTVETKVAAPAIATAVVSTLGAAVYALILAFGWLHPTAGQTAALAGMGAAIVYLVQVVIGYLAPHTHRPDVAAASPLMMHVANFPPVNISGVAPPTSAVAGDSPTPKQTGGLVVGSPPAPVVSAPDAVTPQVSGGNVQVAPEPAAASAPPVAP